MGAGMMPHSWASAQTFMLPYPPPLNHYYYHRGVKRVLSEKGRAYKVDTLVRAKSQGATVFQGELAVSITLFRKARRGDIDGPLKCLLDSLQGIAYVNDSQISELHVLRLEDPANPRVRVTVAKWAKNPEPTP